jgi:integrase
MASVSKDSRWNRYWYAHYTDALGRRRKKSTGLTSKSKALEMAHALQRAANEAKRGTLTEARTRELLSEILQGINDGEGLRVFTVRQWFEHFAKIKAASQDEHTAEKYEQIKREFLEFLGPKANLNILAITSADVRAFRDHRKESGVTATTLNDHLTILSAYFNGAWRDHIISNNPCTAVEPVKDSITPAKRRKQPFSVEQVKALLSEAKGDWHGLIKVAFYTGARLENCANLRFRNLDYSEPPVIVFENYSKHGDEHRVPMHAALKDYLLSLKVPKTKTGDVFLFPSLAERRVANLSKQFRKIMEAARIENWKVREGVRGKGKSAARDVWALGFHSFRRTHVSVLANAGVSEEQRMAITAHATRDIHKGYTHHQLSQLRKAVSVLPRV